MWRVTSEIISWCPHTPVSFRSTPTTISPEVYSTESSSIHSISIDKIKYCPVILVFHWSGRCRIIWALVSCKSKFFEHWWFIMRNVACDITLGHVDCTVYRARTSVPTPVLSPRMKSYIVNLFDIPCDSVTWCDWAFVSYRNQLKSSQFFDEFCSFSDPSSVNSAVAYSRFICKLPSHNGRIFWVPYAIDSVHSRHDILDSLLIEVLALFVRIEWKGVTWPNTRYPFHYNSESTTPLPKVRKWNHSLHTSFSHCI